MDLKCQVCSHDFDLGSYVPRILNHCCDEVICSNCVSDAFHSQEKFVCPLDNRELYLIDRSIQDFPRDPIRIALLQQKKDSQKGQKNKEITLKKEYSDTDNKIHKLKDLAYALDEQFQSLIKKLEEYLGILNNSVKNRIKELKRELDVQEMEMLDKISFFFENERTKLKNVFGIDSVLKRDIKKKISELTQNPNHHDKTSNGELEQIEEKLKYLLSKDHVMGYDSLLNKFSEEFDARLKEKIQEFPRLDEFSSKELSKKMDGICIDRYLQKITPAKKVKLNEPPLQDLSKFQVQKDYVRFGEKPTKIKMEESSQDHQPVLDPKEIKQARRIKIKISDYLRSEENRHIISQTCNQVEHLKLILEPNLEDNELQKLSLDIFKNKKLRELNISFKNCQRISDKGIEVIFMNLSSLLSDLKILILDFRGTKIPNQKLEFFSSNIKNYIHHFQEFKILLSKTGIEDSSIRKLFTRMSNMKIFTLDLLNTKVTDSILELFVAHSLPSMKGLEEFELILPSMKITKQFIPDLFIEFPHLRVFILNLGNINISDESLKNFIRRTLPSLKKLKVFEMNLKETKVTDESISPIFKKLHPLESFKLDLRGVIQITDASLEEFGKYKKNFIKTLDTFFLNLEDTNISDKGVKHLFSFMPKIRIYSLNLSGSKKIKDETIETFISETLVGMRAMTTHLTLYFSGTRISDDAITKLLENVGNLKKLESFKLFLKNTSVTDRNIEDFLEKRVDNLKDLKELYIDLEGTNVSEALQKQVRDYQWQKLGNREIFI